MLSIDLIDVITSKNTMTGNATNAKTRAKKINKNKENVEKGYSEVRGLQNRKNFDESLLPILLGTKVFKGPLSL